MPDNETAPQRDTASRPDLAPELDPPVLTEEKSSGRRRLVRALRHPTRSQAVVGALLALVGFAGVVQIKATENDST